MPLRVCVLTQANPFNWSPHFIEAFRRQCEVITVGPRVPEDTIRAGGRSHLLNPVKPNDVEVGLDQIDDLYGVLPEGWKPHLVVAISGGGIPMFTHTSNLGCPTVFLSVDTWQCFLDHAEATHYDVVFACQRVYVPHLRTTGSRHVRWLPLACAPEKHRLCDGPRDVDVAFVGGASQPVHTTRAALLARIREKYSLLALEHAYGEEMCRAFGRGKLAFNHAAVEDLNMRVFEALAMGCALLTNREGEVNGLLDLFQDGKQLIVYDSADDLLEKIQTYLQDEEARTRIAGAGRAEVLAHHTYAHRIQTILETVEALVPGYAREAAGPTGRGSSLLDYLPRIPGTVVDLGMGLDASKHALRRLGATHFVGIAQDPAQYAQRHRSFDAAFEWPNTPEPETADTLVLAAPRAWGDPAHAMAAAHRLLQPGGTLILRMSDDDRAHGGPPNSTLEAFSAWLRSHEFQPRDLFLVPAGWPCRGGPKTHTTIAGNRFRDPRSPQRARLARRRGRRHGSPRPLAAHQPPGQASSTRSATA